MARRILVTFALALLVTAAIPAGSAQQDSPRSPGAKATSAASDWDLFAEADHEGFSMVNTHSNTSVQEWANTSYERSEDRFFYEYVRIKGDGEDRKRSAANLTFEFTSIYEYLDLNGNGRFDLSDEVVGFHSLDQAGEPTVERADFPRLIEGATVSYPLASGGSLDAEVYTSPRVDFLDTRLIFPSDAELNITIRGQGDVQTQTSYAVQIRAWGGQDIQRHGDRLAFPSDGAESYMTWTDRNSDQPVNATVLENKLAKASGQPADQALLILSAPGGDDVAYGASVGAFTQQTVLETVVATVGSWPLYTLGLIATALIVGTATAAKLRQDRQPGSATNRDPYSQ